MLLCMRILHHTDDNEPCSVKKELHAYAKCINSLPDNKF